MSSLCTCGCECNKSCKIDEHNKKVKKCLFGKLTFKRENEILNITEIPLEKLIALLTLFNL